MTGFFEEFGYFMFKVFMISICLFSIMIDHED